VSTWRNDFNDPPQLVPGENGQLEARPSPRILPHLGWHAVPPGGTVTVPDEQDIHMEAGGWVLVKPAAAPAPTAQAAPAATAAPEGSDQK